MAEFNPLEATGLVISVRDHLDSYEGTCFAFRQPHVVLTASHCIPVDASEIWVDFPMQRARRVAVDIIPHPSADVSIVVTSRPHDDDGMGYPSGAFWNCVGNVSLGEEFMAYGFPTEGPYEEAQSPTPRLFVGHYQRFLRFDGLRGSYFAGEMSIPAPAGLSGGPVFRRGAPPMVTGLVTTNLETYSILDSTEEVDTSGVRTRCESRQVIRYGLAAILSDVEQWLDEHVPHRLGPAYHPG